MVHQKNLRQQLRYWMDGLKINKSEKCTEEMVVQVFSLNPRKHILLFIRLVTNEAVK